MRKIIAQFDEKLTVKAQGFIKRNIYYEAVTSQALTR